jgi:hypothetical protein
MLYRKNLFALGLCAGATVFAQETHVFTMTQDTAHVMSVEFGVAGQVTKGAPYTAQAISSSTQTLADGNRIVNKNTTLLARDSEGRTRREQTLKNVGQWATGQNPPAMILIHDPVAQVSYTLEPNTHTARKRSLSGGGDAFRMKLDAEMAAHGALPPGASNAAHGGSHEGDAKRKHAAEAAVESLGSKVIEGVQADGRRITRTIAAGAMGNEKPIEIVDETWTSPELHVTLYSRHFDPRSGETLYTLTNIQRSEPDPALFKVPQDYTFADSHARHQR